MNTRTQYHPLIILKHQLGVLDDHHYQIIPASTLRNWKGKKLNHIYGFNVNDSNFQDRLVRGVFYSKEIQVAAKALFFIMDAFANVAKLHDQIYNNHDFRNAVIKVVERFGSTISRKKLYQWIGINPQQFYSWRRITCKASIIDLCRVRHSNQLTIHEVKVVKHYLKTYLHHLHYKSDVFSKMVREGAAHMSIRTFYNYARLLKFNNRPSFSAKRKPGLRATMPRQILHMDVTVLKLLDNTKAYIYLIQDNYSRHILNWKVSKSCNSQTAFENLYEACEKYNLLGDGRIDLIVDGGSENKGRLLEFIKQQTTIELKVALKDIPYSNNMIEAENGRIKHRFLYRREYANMEALESELPQIMYKNGNEIPRHYLDFRTPAEAFDAIDIYSKLIEPNIRKAVQKRSVHNKKYHCERYCLKQ